MGRLISEKYAAWQAECEERFQQLKKNEEELNRIFIDIYGLQDELTPDVADKDVTVHRVFDSKDDVPESMKGSNYVRTMRDEIVSLISYAVGCMFGRYSLDVDGLAYAGGEWDASKYKTIIPDSDNIIPICDDEYFDDDITGRFVEFVRKVYGDDTLEENLKFVADALGGKGTPREVIRSYFLNDFYSDHCKTYQKRPIYWLFDSGKKNGFKALCYIREHLLSLLVQEAAAMLQLIMNLCVQSSILQKCTGPVPWHMNGGMDLTIILVQRWEQKGCCQNSPTSMRRSKNSLTP